MLAGAVVALLWLSDVRRPALAAAATPTAGDPSPAALLDSHCAQCHNVSDWAGGLAFELLDTHRVGDDPETWEKAVRKLRARLMPPAGEKQPAQADVDALVNYLETSLDSAANNRIGHVPIQRLNRYEFAASVKGLLGVEIDARQVLPRDIEVEGFSNVAGALSTSPSFVEQYLSAARRVAKLAVGEPVPKVVRVFYRDDGNQEAQREYRNGFPLGTRGGVRFNRVFPADGEYRFSFVEGDSINAGLYPNGMETSATLVLVIDGKEIARRQIGGPDDLALADRDGPQGREALIAKVSNIPAKVTAGPHDVILTFLERSWAESNDSTGGGKIAGIPIIHDGVQVEGPYSPQGLSTNTSRAKIFVCQPRQASEERVCAERITRHLATEAFRRPATEADLKRLMAFYESGLKDGGGFDAGVTELITAILSSPDFLYRAIPASPTPDGSRQLSDLELASRLSFFLWNQNPDDRLLSLATDPKGVGRHLSDPAVLQGEVDRMLKDPRAKSLIEDFALAWLNLGELEQVEPQEMGFGATMRSNFETEIRLFLASVLLENRSVTDLLNANWTFVNEALARQYGIADVFGPQFRRITLKDENRWGLLGKGAVLLRTSYADRTSPVLRGAWVLDRIVGTPPTPPPPNVVTDLSVHPGEKPRTVRIRLELHRANPNCNRCHGLIDPLGLALENFDVTGRWRTVDSAAHEPIDATTEMTSGVVLHGPADLRRALTRQSDQFPMTVARRLMMYALNREIEYFDMPQVRQIVHAAAKDNYTFASLIKGVVGSDAFRQQGPEESKKGAQSQKVAAR
jgi:mono/diheme cytochrome c family protein